MSEFREKNMQLCWSCRRSYLHLGCPWAERGEPVRGWDAEHTMLSNSNQRTDTYVIRRCPLYKCDAPEGINERTYYAKEIDDNSALEELKAAIIKQACADYVDWHKEMVRYAGGRGYKDINRYETAKGKIDELKKWFRSDYYRFLCGIDPNILLRRLDVIVRSGKDFSSFCKRYVRNKEVDR